MRFPMVSLRDNITIQLSNFMLLRVKRVNIRKSINTIYTLAHKTMVCAVCFSIFLYPKSKSYAMRSKGTMDLEAH